MRLFRGLLSLVLALSFVPVSAFGAPVSSPERIDYIEGVAIVKFKSATAEEVSEVAGRHGNGTSDFKRSSHSARQYRVKVPEGVSTERYIESVRRDPSVEYAEKDYIVAPLAHPAPNDPEYNNSATWSLEGILYSNTKSWWLRDSGASSFWANYDNPVTLNGFPVRAANSAFKIAVIDTGFYLSHPDRGANIVAGKDEFQTYDNTTHSYVKDSDVTPAPETAPLNDRQTAAHGTCVAGQIAAATNNGVGVASVGYDNQVVVYKVQGIWVQGDPANGIAAGSAIMFTSAIADAIYSATDAGCKVINMSLGGPSSDAALQDAVNYAHNRGVVVIAATGNDGWAANSYPAACANVVGVGSYQYAAGSVRTRSSFSNYGSQLDILAPGAAIWGLTNPTYDLDGAGTSHAAGYEFWQGTSMAAPAFAGMLAMVWRFAPSLSNVEITQYMLSSATPVGAQPNTQYGYGYVNMANALNRMKVDFPYLAQPSITTTKTVYNSTNVNVAWTPSSGRSVRYEVARDGETATTTEGTSQSFTGLAEGNHDVTVLPLSDYNWYAQSNAASFAFTVDLTPAQVSNLVYDARTITWTDSEGASPHVTMVGVDAAPSQVVTGHSFAIPPGSLAQGDHTFKVRVTDSAGNVSQDFSLSFTSVQPPEAPVLEASYSTFSNPFTLRWTEDPFVDYEYTLNSGPVQSSAEATLSLWLAHGPNTVRVRALKGDDSSTWSETVVNYCPPVPPAPDVPVLPDTPVPSLPVSWGAVAGATSYEYYLNDGGVVTTGATSMTLTGLKKGENTFAVRSANLSGASAWVIRTFTFTPPVPGVPVPVGTGDVVGPSAQITWAEVAGAATYEVELNGHIVATDLTATGALLTDMQIGANTIRVRALNAYSDAGAWSAPLTVTRLVFTVATPTAVTILPGEHGVFTARVTSGDGLPVSGQPVEFQYSYDTVTWTTLVILPTDIAGFATSTYTPVRNAWLRAVVRAVQGNPARIRSEPVRILVKPLLGRAKVPTSVRAKRKFTIYGYLRPKHTNGGKNVKVKLYRYRSGRYRYVKTVTATNRVYTSTATKYMVTTTVPRRGSWRAYPVYVATSRMVASRAAYTSFRAR